MSAGLILATLLAYAPALKCDFVAYDDPGYVTANPVVRSGVNAYSIAWAFTTPLGGFWQPLTVLSHALDCRLFGLNPAGHHAVNLAFHLLNVLLVFGLFRRLTGGLWRGALVAALFALHPVNVESVAWVAERKTLLCMGFWLLASWSHVEYVRRSSFHAYLLTLLFMLLALMSKPMAVTLPFALLLLDYWPLRRMDSPSTFGRLLLEKAPLIALAALFSVVAYATQNAVGAVVPDSEMSPGARLAGAAVNYVRYLDKLFWPVSLAVLYPQPPPVPARVLVISLGLLALVTVLAIRRGARFPYLPAGWFWYLGTMVPMIGVVVVGYHSIADRFLYLPSLGLFVIVSWGCADLVARSPRLRGWIAGGAGIVLLALAIQTHTQLAYWRDSVSLFSRATAVTRDNFVMYDNLGRQYAMAGRLDDAIAEFAKAIRANAYCRSARANLAMALLQKGRLDEAIALQRDSVARFPDDGQLRCDLGLMLADAGLKDEAVARLREAVLLDPGLAKAHFRLALLLLEENRAGEAIPHLAATVRLKPDSAQARALLDQVAAKTGESGR